MLSATATLGLVILYDTIFKHGALNVATTMSESSKARLAGCRESE